MTYLTKELRAFSEMLGKKQSKIEAGTVTAIEYDDIAEFRLAQQLGADVDDPSFQETWKAVLSLSYEFMGGDDDANGSDLVTPSETELSGLPDRCWTFTVLASDETVLRHVVVYARTSGEAMRVVEASNIPGIHGLTLPIRAATFYRQECAQ